MRVECHQEDGLPEGEPQIVSPEGGDQAGERDKLFAARMIERLERKHRFVEDQFATSSRWLAASLLAVNSGGALAVANAARQSDAIACPGLCFLFGAVSALASGAVIQELYSRMTPLLAEQDDYWITIKIPWGWKETDALSE